MKDFSELEKKLGINFKKRELLVQAFCHRSYINENPSFNLGHNERLEFLGDAVLELVVTEYLYNLYQDEPEGSLTAMRASLVNATILSEVSEELGFDQFILLSKGEVASNGKKRETLLADTFEAVIGAIYLDEGYNLCKEFIKKHLTIKLPDILKLGLHKDFKSRFQEEAQSRVGITPSYGLIEESGPDHRKLFVLGAYLGDEIVAKGRGYSKQKAEEDAAEKALKIKGWDDNK